jgi:hypothetical protein
VVMLLTCIKEMLSSNRGQHIRYLKMFSWFSSVPPAHDRILFLLDQDWFVPDLLQFVILQPSDCLLLYSVTIDSCIK